MPATLIRYTFSPVVPFEEIEGTLFLAFLGCESLHGELAVRL